MTYQQEVSEKYINLLADDAPVRVYWQGGAACAEATYEKNGVRYRFVGRGDNADGAREAVREMLLTHLRQSHQVPASAG